VIFAVFTPVTPLSSDAKIWIHIFSNVTIARRRFGYNEPESQFVCAAGPAALNILWRPTKNGLMTTSKMSWQMFAAIGYSRCWMLDTCRWSLVAGNCELQRGSQKPETRSP
jgi:hypothetical protein